MDTHTVLGCKHWYWPTHGCQPTTGLQGLGSEQRHAAGLRGSAQPSQLPVSILTFSSSVSSFLSWQSDLLLSLPGLHYLLSIPYVPVVYYLSDFSSQTFIILTNTWGKQPKGQMIYLNSQFPRFQSIMVRDAYQSTASNIGKSKGREMMGEIYDKMRSDINLKITLTPVTTYSCHFIPSVWPQLLKFLYMQVHELKPKTCNIQLSERHFT